MRPIDWGKHIKPDKTLEKHNKSEQEGILLILSFCIKLELLRIIF